MSEVIGKHYLDLDIHQNNYVSFTCKQDNSAEHIYVTIYDNGEHINNLTTLLTSLDVKIETPDSRHLKLSTSDVWQRCKKDDVGAILITSNNISTYRPYILDIAVGEYVRKGTSELITITNDTVEIHLPQSVFLENGKCKGEIILIQDDSQLATMDFQINIIKSVYTDKEIIDDAYTESEVAQLKNYMSEYAKRAKNSASNAAISEEHASSSATTAINKASEASTSATKAKTSESNAKASEINASSSATIATTKASEASTSATKAKNSETNAKNSETNAKSSENVAIAKASQADVSANNASTSETNASNSATLSKSWAIGGTGTRTGEDTNNSKYYSTQASSSAQNAKNSETNAKVSETNAKEYMDDVHSYKLESQSWAVGGTGSRTDEDTDNSKYYSEQSKFYAKQAEQSASYDYTQVLQELENIKSSVATDEDIDAMFE